MIYIHIHLCIIIYVHTKLPSCHVWTLSSWKASVPGTYPCASGEFIQLNDLLNGFEDVWDFLIWGDFSWFNSAGDPCFWYDKSSFIVFALHLLKMCMWFSSKLSLIKAWRTEESSCSLYIFIFLICSKVLLIMKSVPQRRDSYMSKLVNMLVRNAHRPEFCQRTSSIL